MSLSLLVWISKGPSLLSPGQHPLHAALLCCVSCIRRLHRAGRVSEPAFCASGLYLPLPMLVGRASSHVWVLNNSSVFFSRTVWAAPDSTFPRTRQNLLPTFTQCSLGFDWHCLDLQSDLRAVHHYRPQTRTSLHW